MSALAALPLIATPAHIRSAWWGCCGTLARTLNTAERGAVEYTCDWHSIYPIPRCPSCGLPMVLEVVPAERAAQKAEAQTRLRTRTEIREATQRTADFLKQLAETPERTLVPFGDHAGQPMEAVPDYVLHRLRQHYTARRRVDLKRSRELVRAIDAALEQRPRRDASAFPAALRDDADDGLPDWTEQSAAPAAGHTVGSGSDTPTADTPRHA